MNELTSSILRNHQADPTTFSLEPKMPGVWSGCVPGPRAKDLWFALRDAFKETSRWPVIRGKPAEREDSPVDADATLAAVRHRPLPEIFAFRLEEQRSFAVDTMGLHVPPDATATKVGQMLDASGAFAFGGRKQPPTGWPTEPRKTADIEFVSTGPLGSPTTFPLVEMSLVALQHPYEAPAYLGFGGWNDCPEPAIQVAVLRDWFERFGAVPAAMTHDVMECVVARPPMNEADSLQLAAEQWLFCDDIVSQGTMSVRGLAIDLWQQPQWFFWWD